MPSVSYRHHHHTDPLLLHRYFHAVHFDVGAAQKLLELSFSVRNSNPKIFLDRDPSSKASLQMLQTTYVWFGHEGTHIIFYNRFWDMRHLNVLEKKS